MTYTKTDIPDAPSLPAQPKNLVIRVGLLDVQIDNIDCIPDKSELWVERHFITFSDNITGKKISGPFGMSSLEGNLPEVFIITKTPTAYTFTRKDGSQALFNQVLTVLWSEPTVNAILTSGGPNTIKYDMDVFLVRNAPKPGAANCPPKLKLGMKFFSPKQTVRFK